MYNALHPRNITVVQYRTMSTLSPNLSYPCNKDTFLDWWEEEAFQRFFKTKNRQRWTCSLHTNASKIISPFDPEFIGRMSSLNELNLAASALIFRSRNTLDKKIINIAPIAILHWYVQLLTLFTCFTTLPKCAADLQLAYDFKFYLSIDIFRKLTFCKQSYRN